MQQTGPVQTQQGYYRPKEYDPANEIDPLQKPEGYFYLNFSEILKEFSFDFLQMAVYIDELYGQLSILFIICAAEQYRIVKLKNIKIGILSRFLFRWFGYRFTLILWFG